MRHATLHSLSSLRLSELAPDCVALPQMLNRRTLAVLHLLHRYPCHGQQPRLRPHHQHIAHLTTISYPVDSVAKSSPAAIVVGISRGTCDRNTSKQKEVRTLVRPMDASEYTSGQMRG
jgi:hypothetical protein